MICKYCKEEISDNAVKCKHCQSIIKGTETDAVTRMLVPVGQSGFAIASGYLGLISIIAVTAPFAIIFGIIGLIKIKNNPYLHGKFRAWVGILSGIGWLLFWVFFVFVYMD